MNEMLLNRCDDPDIEDFGNKWSMSAMLRLLKAEGKDTFSLMMAIEDVVIKTLLTVESQISAACRMFLSTRGNCFGKTTFSFYFKIFFYFSFRGLWI